VVVWFTLLTIGETHRRRRACKPRLLHLTLRVLCRAVRKYRVRERLQLRIECSTAVDGRLHRSKPRAHFRNVCVWPWASAKEHVGRLMVQVYVSSAPQSSGVDGTAALIDTLIAAAQCAATPARMKGSACISLWCDDSVMCADRIMQR
jgi:hypothetical protein